MKTIEISTRKSHAIEEWRMKEFGSWEDHKYSLDHPCSLLLLFGGKTKLTEQQAEALIKSGSYHSTAWQDDEIVGGARTKAVIAKYVAKLKEALK